MHFCLLLGFGANAINPYLAFETVADWRSRGRLKAGLTVQDAIQNYMQAVKKGMLKTISKMGISTVRSYRGSQIFEAIGLDAPLIEEFFPGTTSRIGGSGLEVVIEEALRRHRLAFPNAPPRGPSSCPVPASTSSGPRASITCGTRDHHRAAGGHPPGRQPVVPQLQRPGR